MVRSYTDDELLAAVQEIPSIKNGTKKIPSGFWLICVRAKVQKPDKFTDKFYLFKGRTFQKMYTGTTIPGLVYLKKPVNPKGTAILVANEFYEDSWARGMHKGKVWAYVQVRPVKVHRDNDFDNWAEEDKPIYEGLFGINIHPSSYIKGSHKRTVSIGYWSAGCLVFDVRAEEDDFMERTKGQTYLSVALIKET